MKEIIKQLEEELRLAMLSSDIDVLDRLIADSLIFTAPNGVVISKEIDLNCHKSKLQQMTQMTPSEQVIQIYDGYAVVSAKMSILGSFNGESIDGDYRYNRTWSEYNGNLQVTSGAVVKII